MGSWSKIRKSQVRFGSMQKTKSAPESAEYQQWRDRFLNKRLSLCLWLAFPCLLTYTFNDLLDSEFGWNRWIEADFARIGFAFICAIVYQTKWGKRNSQWVMLWLSWSITMLPNVWTILRGMPAPSQVPLNMVFVTQTTLMPVYWRIHLLSQTGAVFSHWSCFYWGRGNLEDELDLGLSLVYWFWIGFICTLAVLLYERLQKREFIARRELDIFLHSVSHDLRAPVTGTSMVLSNLITKASNNNNKVAVERRILERLLQGSDRQLSMINSLLEAQATSHHGISLKTQPCRLKQLVAAIILDLKPILQQNRVQVRNRVAADLPQVAVDPLQLRRVFNNLITNAFKHNPPGIDLVINSVTQERMIRIEVADNGVGIPPKQRSKLFELYARGDRARYMPGLGMGLYLCQQIIQAHQGEIGFETNCDRGSTFWFTLPL